MSYDFASLANQRAEKSRRGQVARTYKDVSVLAGFMDDEYFRAFAADQIGLLDRGGIRKLMEQVQEARDFVSTLGETELSQIELRRVDPRVTSRIESDDFFRSAYSRLTYRFSWINPRKLIAVQVSRQVGKESVPTDSIGLIEYALPTDWSVPAEICFVPPFGPIYFTGDSPQLGGIRLSIDDKTGNVLIGPANQVNLIQVVSFEGRHYLRNGYHRVVSALEAGLSEIPALLVEAGSAAEVELTNLGLASLNVATLMALTRPPLVADFLSEASLNIKMREKRYGCCINLQASPIIVPV